MLEKYGKNTIIINAVSQKAAGTLSKINEE
jgi:hypothetical protein